MQSRQTSKKYDLIDKEKPNNREKEMAIYEKELQEKCNQAVKQDRNPENSGADRNTVFTLTY